MGYTGDVRPGGPADTREAAGLTIRKASVGTMDNNSYLLTCTQTGKQLLIDAADDAQRLLALVDEGSGRLGAVLTTHRHADHHRALAAVVQATDARTLAGADDADDLPVDVDRRLRHGDVVEVGTQRLDVIELRGHTPGAIALAWREPGGVTHLFTGDSLFPGGPGKTNTPEDFTSLMDDLESRVFGVYGDDAWVYPGHGADTTLAAERPHLRQWRQRGW